MVVPPEQLGKERNTGKTWKDMERHLNRALYAIQAVDFSSVLLEITSDLAVGFDHWTSAREAIAGELSLNPMFFSSTVLLCVNMLRC